MQGAREIWKGNKGLDAVVKGNIERRHRREGCLGQGKYRREWCRGQGKYRKERQGCSGQGKYRKDIEGKGAVGKIKIERIHRRDGVQWAREI